MTDISLSCFLLTDSVGKEFEIEGSSAGTSKDRRYDRVQPDGLALSLVF